MSGELLIKPGEPGEAALFTIDVRGRSHATDADEIGLTDELAERIEAWLDALDAVYHEDAPGLRAFASDAERRAFVAEGQAIATDIRSELGDDWRVHIDLTPWDTGLA